MSEDTAQVRSQIADFLMECAAEITKSRPQEPEELAAIMEEHLARRINEIPGDMRAVFLRQMGVPIPPSHFCTLCLPDHKTVGVSVRPAEAGTFKVQFTVKE